MESPFSDFPHPVREVRRFPRARARGNEPHGRRSALRPIAPHLSLLTSPLTCPTHNLTGRGPQRAWRSVRTILRRKRRCVGHLTYLNNLPFTYLTATIFYARNLHLNMAGPSPSLASISAGPHGRPVRPEPLGLFRTSSSRVSSGPIRQVRWPLTRRAISCFHFCPHDPRAHAALRSMSRYVHMRARLCLHARAVWHAAEHAHDLRRSTRATPCPVRAGRGFSS